MLFGDDDERRLDDVLDLVHRDNRSEDDLIGVVVPQLVDLGDLVAAEGGEGEAEARGVLGGGAGAAEGGGIDIPHHPATILLTLELRGAVDANVLVLGANAEPGVADLFEPPIGGEVELHVLDGRAVGTGGDHLDARHGEGVDQDGECLGVPLHADRAGLVDLLTGIRTSLGGVAGLGASLGATRVVAVLLRGGERRLGERVEGGAGGEDGEDADDREGTEHGHSGEG